MDWSIMFVNVNGESQISVRFNKGYRLENLKKLSLCTIS